MESAPLGDETVDVVVLGSGAAGFVAALAAHDSGASVALVEKTATVGGTTAMSGAIMWMPANKYAAEAGIEDSVDEAMTYIMANAFGRIDERLARTFVETIPELLDWFETNTHVQMRLVPNYPDYQPEKPGGKPAGGRSLEPELFPFDQLGEWQDRVTMSRIDGRVRLGEKFAQAVGQFAQTFKIDESVMADRVAQDVRSGGQAFVGAALKSCLERGIVPRTQTAARELVVEEGRVAGVTVSSPAGDATLRARRGVILATGGFEWNSDLCKAFLRGPMTAPTSYPGNTGDGLRMAMKLGVSLGNMSEAWWMPAVRVADTGHFGDHPRNILTLSERTIPGSLMVNRTGRRFTNESANYNAFGGAMHQFEPTAFDFVNLPCWLIFDDAAFQRFGYPGAQLPPGTPAPDWLVQAGTLAELARKIGVPADELDKTVERFNANAKNGQDPDFHRGESAYDGWNGDKAAEGPFKTLGPLVAAPYYAVEIRPGTLGTKGGPKTDRDGQVLDVDGVPVPGLFAAGNVMAGVTGMLYGGAGGTIGPASVFGYRAGRRAARG